MGEGQYCFIEQYYQLYSTGNKNTLRIILMFISVIAVIVGFVLAFGWFPITEIKAWIMFILCFIVSCVISTFVSVVSEKQENKKLEEALKRFKEGQ